MAPAAAPSVGWTLTLNEDERTHRLTLLEQAVHDRRIEVYRTEAFAA